MCLVVHALTGLGDGVDDFIVTGAAAQVAGDGRSDLGVAGGWVGPQQIQGGNFHAGGAESALNRPFFDKRLLDGRALSAFFTMVAMGENGKPREIKPYVPQTEEEIRLFEAAKARRLQRKAQKTRQ